MVEHFHHDPKFEADMEEFELNRMYPVGHKCKYCVLNQRDRKEATMKRLDLDHVGALSRAEQAVLSGIVSPMSPILRTSIEKDIERIADIKRFILRTIYQPGLPFTSEIPEKKETNGNPDS